MRKTGIETDAYFGINDSEKGFYQMKSHGFDCADYQNLLNTENELFSLSENEFEKHLLNDAKHAKNAGIEIYQVHGPWRYPPRDTTQEDRAERSEKFKKVIRGTALLGSKYMIMHPIMPWGPHAAPDEKLFWDMNIEFISNLLPTAEKENVVICLENMPFPAHPITTSEHVHRFITEINHPNLKACLDTGHALVCKKNPADDVRLLKDSLVTMHVHDNKGDLDYHLTPYSGVCDWEDFRNALTSISEEVPLILETMPNRSTPKHIAEEQLRTLCKIAQYLGNK